MMKGIRGRGLLCVAVLMVAIAMLLDVTHATEWIVGGAVAKWGYIGANRSRTFYQDWASNNTYVTGDSLLFDYDNAAHTVMQLATATDYTNCKLNASIIKWGSGRDSVFISTAGTYYYVCGAPSHCRQGMKFFITATGDLVPAPPPPPGGSGPTGANSSHASPTAIFFGAGLSLGLSISVAAFHSF